MKRIIDRFTHQPIGHQRQRDVMGLQRYFHIVKILRFENSDVLHRRLDKSFRSDAPVFFQKFFIQGAAVDADADWNPGRFRLAHHGLDSFLAADVSWIQPECRNTLPNRLQRQPIVKMNVGHQRHVHGTNNIS